VVRTLYVRVATLKFIRLWIGSQWRLERSWDVGTERGERVIVLAKAFLYHLKFMKVGCGSNK